ncbi:MAG: hypothetical protein E7396_10100 [Ruminococcaceae bacterium]|nr:hypothetical protein [Oscillospiraceae bacterium]
MTSREKSEFIKRINLANKECFRIPEDLHPESCVRGVYGLFAVRNNEEIPFYIGKSNNIFLRMFSKNSHVYSYMRGVRKTDVHYMIERYLSQKYIIEIRILKKVKYVGDAFEKDANRLAFAELKELIKYQNMGFCLEQLSEAVKEKYERIEWESKYLISSE